ncbi:putative zinc finger protein [Orchesella cincta]|uniref:Putative zinc finger protein n=1 Tax=Orchesella cincta TaxID=48709 RepID=A0A1D2M863_ORCCI|nr:putative zinc finger protein [Orchesella cincta]
MSWNRLNLGSSNILKILDEMFVEVIFSKICFLSSIALEGLVPSSEVYVPHFEFLHFLFRSFPFRLGGRLEFDTDGLGQHKGKQPSLLQNLIYLRTPREIPILPRQTMDEDEYQEESGDDDDHDPQPTREQASSSVDSKAEEKNDSKFICHQCGTAFKAKRNLLQHVNSVHNSKPQVCPHCQGVFSAARYLREHINRSHPDSADLMNRQKCPKCDKLLIRRSHWESHVASCGSETVAVCITPIIETPPVKNEENQSDSEEEPGFPCPSCGKVFETQQRLCVHKSNVHTDKLLRCPVCRQVFKRKKAIENHITRLHESESYACGECDQTFAIAKDLVEHIALQHPLKKVKRYECQKCGRSVEKLFLLERHAKHCKGKL